MAVLSTNHKILAIGGGSSSAKEYSGTEPIEIKDYNISLNSSFIDKVNEVSAISGKQDILTDYNPDLWNEVTAKQNELLFNYNEGNEITGINSSAIAGGGSESKYYHSASGTLLVDNSHLNLEGTTSAINVTAYSLGTSEYLSYTGDEPVTASIFINEPEVLYDKIKLKFTNPSTDYNYSFDYKISTVNPDTEENVYYTGQVNIENEELDEDIYLDYTNQYYQIELSNITSEEGYFTISYEPYTEKYNKVELQEKLEAGSGIDITNNTISLTGSIIPDSYIFQPGSGIEFIEDNTNKTVTINSIQQIININDSIGMIISAGKSYFGVINLYVNATTTHDSGCYLALHDNNGICTPSAIFGAMTSGNSYQNCLPFAYTNTGTNNITLYPSRVGILDTEYSATFYGSII